MELRPDVKQRLRNTSNWSTLIEELEREVDERAAAQSTGGAKESKQAKAAALLELGVLCEEFFLRKDRAMVQYQTAFKTYPQDTTALERAISIYREMGNLDMVCKLLGIELKGTKDPAIRAALQGRLGIAQLDLGQLDKALANLEVAREARPDDTAVADAYAAATYDREDWIDATERLAKQAAKSDAATAARIYLRIARIYNTEVPGDAQYESALRKVIDSEPENEQAHFLLEGVLGTTGRVDDLVKLHEQRAAAAGDESRRAVLYQHFASTWALRIADKERAAHFYRKALETSYRLGSAGSNGIGSFPGHLAAFGFLRDEIGPRGHFADLLAVADLGLRSGLDDDDLVILAAQAGAIAWRDLNDPARAKPYFETVLRIDPKSAANGGLVGEFVAAIGPLGGAPSPAPRAPELRPPMLRAPKPKSLPSLRQPGQRSKRPPPTLPRRLPTGCLRHRRRTNARSGKTMEKRP